MTFDAVSRIKKKITYSLSGDELVMLMFVLLNMFVYLYAYVRVYAYFRVLICICSCTYMHMFVYMHMFLYAYVRVSLYMHMFVYYYAYLHVYAYVREYMQMFVLLNMFVFLYKFLTIFIIIPSLKKFMNKKLTHDELKSTKNAAGSFIYIYSKRVYCILLQFACYFEKIHLQEALQSKAFFFEKLS